MRSSADRLDHAAVAVAGREVLLAVNSRWVFAENRFHATALLEEAIPVRGGEEPQAEHAVADCDLIGSLTARFAGADLTCAPPSFRPGAKVFQKDQAKHGGQSPELANRERKSLLKRPDELNDSRFIELAVGVCDDGQGQRINAGIAAQRRDGELR